MYPSSLFLCEGVLGEFSVINVVIFLVVKPRLMEVSFMLLLLLLDKFDKQELWYQIQSLSHFLL